MRTRCAQAIVALLCSCTRGEPERTEASSGPAKPTRFVQAAPIDIHGRGCVPLAWFPPKAGDTWRVETERLGGNLVSIVDPTTRIARAYRCPEDVLDTLVGPEAEKTSAPKLAPVSPELVERCFRERDAEACLEAADRSIDNDFEPERSYLDAACEAGLPIGCFLLARRTSDESPLRARGMSVYERRCKAGDRSACEDAATIYRSGLGVPADSKKADELLGK